MPAEFSLRRATGDDQADIRVIVREGRINPMGLAWSNFIVAVDEASGQVVGTGQIKSHGDGSRELASIAVRPAHRQRGIATAIIRRLLDESAGPLYLTCRHQLGPFYEPFGFRAIPLDEMPTYYRRLKRFVRLFEKLVPGAPQLLVMRLER